MENLSKLLDGPQLFIKRDDCTGLATGGNKTRKLEFLIGDALDKDADTVITFGAVQSNHTRQTAAAAARYGLACHILLERRVPDTDPLYETTGNVFLEKLLGATIHFHGPETDMAAAAEALRQKLKNEGAKPYIIPGGGSSPIGALGYVNAAMEMVQQFNTLGLDVSHVVHGTGSGGTQSGLVAGFSACNDSLQVLGICVRHPKEKQEDHVYALASNTLKHLGCNFELPREAVKAFDAYIGPGYGQLTPETEEAIQLLARHEGILLDPVYTGKAMAGFIGLIRDGHFSKHDNVVFVHTGGSAALFAYPSLACFDLKPPALPKYRFD